jgi:hypothetical protein
MATARRTFTDKAGRGTQEKEERSCKDMEYYHGVEKQRLLTSGEFQ